MTEEEHFLDNPDVDELYNKLPILINESDRGTILLGVSQIDYELQILLDSIAPKEMSNKEKKWISRANLSSKLNFAYTCRIIPKNLYDSISILRIIRNDIAHKVETFNLNDYESQLKNITEILGKNMNPFIEQISIHLLTTASIEIIMSLKHPKDKNKPIFHNRQEAIKYLEKNKNLYNKIEEPKLRTKLSISILIICALIIYHRKKSLQILSENKVISSL